MIGINIRRGIAVCPPIIGTVVRHIYAALVQGCISRLNVGNHAKCGCRYGVGAWSRVRYRSASGATLDDITEFIIAIKGPLTTPIGGGIRSLNVALRQSLDLYTCLRPVQYFPGVPSPVKKPEDVDMVIFRENTEDIYAGIEYQEGTPEVKKLIKFLQEEMGVTKIRFPETSGIGIKPVSEEGTKRLVRAAIDYALAEGRKSVTLVHKGNIMKFTEGAFKQWGYDVAEQEYGDKVFTWDEYDRIKEREGST